MSIFSFRPGFIKQPWDARDRVYGAPLEPVNVESVDLRKQMPAPLDQGSYSTCVVHGVQEIALAAVFVSGYQKTLLSRAYHYWRARELSGFDPRIDEGAFIRDGIKSLVKWGAPPEEKWEYRNVCQKPPKELDALAEKYQALVYESVRPTVHAIQHAITSGHPVVFGMDLYANFFDVGKSGIIPAPRYSNEGGHCMAICGFSNAEQQGIPANSFIIQNSWGTKWGRAGCGFMNYDAFLACEPTDCWILTQMEHGD